MILTPLEALEHLQTLYQIESEGSIAKQSWQTLKSVVLAQQTTNTASTPCLCHKYGHFVKCSWCDGKIFYPIKQ